MSISPKITPIYQTSVFTFDDLNALEAYFQEPGQHYMYTRYGNPNSEELAQEVNKLERGAGAVATSSGMSAILTAVLVHAQAGDHVLCAEEIYGGSSSLLSNELSRLGIEVTYVPTNDIYSLEGYVRDNTKLFLAETISNPMMMVMNLAQLAQECQSKNIKLVVDNTFASPILTRPLELGADMVIHSVTKYLSGHSDVTAGVVISKNEADAARAGQIMRTWGLNLSPFESWLGARGLKTLKLRMRQHSTNGQAIAEFLEQHPKVQAVFYPGLADHPQHTIAEKQGNGLFGGMLSFRIADDTEAVNRFMKALSHIPFAPSLAGVTTSISYPLGTSHRGLTQEQQEKMGISVGLIRLSVGIEEAEDLIADLGQALEAI
ncbi:trans-sulfuration enzyme family protein [Rufibacter latericius]|uniref:Aminotransferase class I/II-fold pyridoxal phosphate-dependent enzyme n=1 Tax=Rufibacter latericius TaxID=2487040 RepID=A0A3M9N246_9BACT|nr:aminotransferase class I/II-fold pyridoxal phosphate-dependent enzyme [Rufibacter latericius]RNI31475.1 aminotransferase class I/II-fold pyridoxal phosphate-dependent enzyme [Rufibacter latericius]